MEQEIKNDLVSATYKLLGCVMKVDPRLVVPISAARAIIHSLYPNVTVDPGPIDPG